MRTFLNAFFRECWKGIKEYPKEWINSWKKWKINIGVYSIVMCTLLFSHFGLDDSHPKHLDMGGCIFVLCSLIVLNPVIQNKANQKNNQNNK